MERDQDHTADLLEITIAWMPSSMGSSSLLAGTRALAPALLYADRVTVWSPESDDALELADYRELQDGRLAETVRFEALTSGRWRVQSDGDSAAHNHFGSLGHDDNFIGNDHQARAALSEWYVDRLWTHHNNGAAIDEIKPLLKRLCMVDRSAVRDFLWNATIGEPDFEWSLEQESFEWHDSPYGYAGDEEDIREEVLAQVLLMQHTMHSAGTIALLDDVRGTLSSTSTAVAKSAIRESRELFAKEGSIGVGMIQRLPSIRSVSWDVVADVRKELRSPLVRFRAAVLALADAASTHPVDADFEGVVEQIWRSEVSPALVELEALTQEQSLRSLFFEDVLGDLSTYVGPAIGLAAADVLDVSAWVGATLGLTSPIGKLIAEQRRKKNLTPKREFFYLHELARRI